MSNASNLSTLANVLDDGSDGQFLKSTGSGGVAFDTVAAGAVVYATADLLPLSGNSAGDMAYVTATNRFYINNGSGWYSVSLVNTNPNITSVQDAGSNTTPFTLATDGTATVITVTAADPEDIPLTYGYSVTSGSLNGSTVTQGTGSNTNVFTVTPHASQDATFTLTFTASDGINQATSANAFSLSFVTIVTDSNHTTLLATATGTSDNNNITDSSSNSHSITVNGDAHAGTFSPYRSGGYSTYFDGSSDNISLTANSGFSLDGNFTIECWFNPSSITLDSQHPSILKIGTTQIYLNSSNDYVGFYHGTNDVVKSANSSIIENQWYHVSVTRSGSVLTLFLDGVSVDTANNSTATFGASSGTVDIGTYSGTGGDFHGYITDLRVVKGTAITPPSGGPTERLEAVTNTSLLTCHLPYIADGSTNDHSITINGDPSTKPFSPYDYEEYDAADHGGSVYFDGNNDYLDVSDASLDLDGDDWSIEAWWYPTNLTQQNQVLIDTRPDISLLILLNRTGSGDTYVYTGNGSGGYIGAPAIDSGSNSPIIESQWNHISLVKNGSSIYLYHNGQQVGSSTYLPSGFNGTMRIGAYESSGSSGDYLYGYISDLRIVKGTAVYTGGFTPPSGPLTTTGGTYSITTNVNTSITSGHTKLLLKGTDASIIDKSQGANLKLFGDTTGSTTQAKFSNTKSIYFDGSGDGILCKGTQIPTGATESWTIEAWVYVANTSIERQIFAQYSAGSSSTRFVFGVTNAKFRVFNGGTSLYSLNAASLNTWTHVAVTYNGSAAELYVDGISQGTVTLNRGVDDVDLQIGARNEGATQPWVGYIQDARVTKGKARYTANFTPPSAPLEG